MKFIGSSSIHLVVSSTACTLGVMLGPKEFREVEEFILDNDIPEQKVKELLLDWLPKRGYEPDERAPYVMWTDLVPEGKSINKETFIARYKDRILREQKIISPAHNQALRQEVINEILAEQQDSG